MDFDNLIVAALATCMIIIVFATAVTFLQQGIFKLTQSRRIGMIRLLEKLYDGAVKPRLPAPDGDHQPEPAEVRANAEDPKKRRGLACRRFALTMTVNQTFKPWPWLEPFSKAWVLRRYFGGRLQRMSTRQFVEHLANTWAGKRFEKLGDIELQKELRDLAYEFERYGEEQWRAFRMNTTMFTVIIGIMLAFAFNVDIWRTLNMLAANPDRATLITGALSSHVTEAEGVVRDIAAAEDSFVRAEGETADAQTGDRTGPGAGGAPAVETTAPLSEAEKKEAVADVRQKLKQARTSLEDSLNSIDISDGKVLDLGLPIGLGIYPFCVRPPLTADEAAGKEDTRRFSDPRCNDGIGEIDPLSVAGEIPTAPLRYFFNGGQDKAAKPKSQLDAFLKRLGNPSGLAWVLSVLFSGALFGLGAPFWFDVFNQLSAMANRRPFAQLTPDRQPQGGQTVESADARNATGQTAAAPSSPRRWGTAVRENQCVTPEELLDAFRIAQRSR